MYISNYDHDFTQQFPRFTCKNARRFHEISEFKGYSVKCRNARCSLSCHANWARKQAAILARHLHDLPPAWTCYRGSLTLPPGADPKLHHAVRAAFLLILKRWKLKTGAVAEIHAVTHPTSAINAHYDLLAYSDSPEFPGWLREAWVRAGGRRASCVPLHQDEKDATARYQVKAPANGSNNKDRETDKTPPPKLLRSRQESGLDQSWHTRSSKSSLGFWNGCKPDLIWAMLCEEWFPVIDESDLLARAASRSAAGLPPVPLKLPEPEPIPVPYIPGDDARLDRIKFASMLPDDPDNAVGVNDYAARWGVDGTYMQKILRSIPGAHCLQGRKDRSGHHVYNAWHNKKIGTMEMDH